MLNTPRIRNLYSKIQNQIFNMIPEKWDRLYLYASVIEQINNLQTGEMFFYYFPKGIIKKNPVNAYEVPSKFNVDEDAYMKLADRLYKTIKELRKEYIMGNEKVWSNITISIENFKFKAEFGYEDLLYSKYSNYERHLIWKYEYLDLKLESLNRKERKMIEQYLKEKELELPTRNVYTESIYDRPIQNKIEYNTKAKENQEIDPTKITDFTLPDNRQTKRMTKRSKALQEAQEKLEIPDVKKKKKKVNKNIEIISKEKDDDTENNEKNIDIIHTDLVSPLDEEIQEETKTRNFILQAPMQTKPKEEKNELEKLLDDARKKSREKAQTTQNRERTQKMQDRGRIQSVQSRERTKSPQSRTKLQNTTKGKHMDDKTRKMSQNVKKIPNQQVRKTNNIQRQRKNGY